MKKSIEKYDINIEKVVCPDCRAKQPSLRIPKNFDQLLWGGWTCEKCSCKMDKHGKKIEE